MKSCVISCKKIPPSLVGTSRSTGVWCRARVAKSLVRVETTSTPTTIATTVLAATGHVRAASSGETASSTETTTSTATASTHARDVGTFRRDLDVAALEHTVVQYQGLRDQAGLGKLDVSVAIAYLATVCRCNKYGKSKQYDGSPYPFGWPVNLSSRMVTRLIEPQLWKCAWMSSGEAE